MKKGRYNIVLPSGEIKKFNVYQNDYSNYFIFLNGTYQQVKRREEYKGGWLWGLAK